MLILTPTLGVCQYLYKTLKTPWRGLFELLVTETRDQVVVYHANTLHKGINGCGAHKPESPSPHIFA